MQRSFRNNERIGDTIWCGYRNSPPTGANFLNGIDGFSHQRGRVNLSGFRVNCHLGGERLRIEVWIVRVYHWQLHVRQRGDRLVSVGLHGQRIRFDRRGADGLALCFRDLLATRESQQPVGQFGIFRDGEMLEAGLPGIQRSDWKEILPKAHLDHVLFSPVHGEPGELNTDRGIHFSLQGRRRVGSGGICGWYVGSGRACL